MNSSERVRLIHGAVTNLPGFNTLRDQRLSDSAGEVTKLQAGSVATTAVSNQPWASWLCLWRCCVHPPSLPWSPSPSFSPSPFSRVVLVLEKDTLALASDIIKIKNISEKKTSQVFLGFKKEAKRTFLCDSFLRAGFL